MTESKTPMLDRAVGAVEMFVVENDIQKLLANSTGRAVLKYMFHVFEEAKMPGIALAFQNKLLHMPGFNMLCNIAYENTDEKMRAIEQVAEDLCVQITTLAKNSELVKFVELWKKLQIK